MKQSLTRQSSKSKSVFQQSVAGMAGSKSLKNSAQSKSELPAMVKGKQQTGSKVLEKGSAHSNPKQIMRDSQRKQSTLKKKEESFEKGELIRPSRTIPVNEADQIINEQPEGENEQISEVYNNTYNIEQEHSYIVLNEAFARQASKKAFERLLKESENVDDQIIDQEDEQPEQRKFSEGYKQCQKNFIDTVASGSKKKNDQQEQDSQKKQPSDEDYDKEYKEVNLNYSLQIKVNHDFQWTLREVKSYRDDYRFLLLRKILFLVISTFEIICYQFLQSVLFDLFEIILTLSNILLFLNRSGEDSQQIQQSQQVLCACYFIDVLIHFTGQGLKLYIQSFWNLYDLTILILYFLFITGNGNIPFDVSTFRVIRIPVYFGRISNTLNIMLKSIKEAVKQIVENILILILFTILIAIIMLYAFNGVLRYRCMQEELGIFSFESYEESVCGFHECVEEGFICSRQLENFQVPTHFDNIIASYFQTIRTSVVNSWTITMYMLMKQFNPAVCFLYIFIIFAINKFYFQLLVAVLKVYYHKTQEFYEKHPVKPDFFEDQITINLKGLQVSGLWKQFKICRHNYLLGRTARLASRSCSSGSLNELMSRPPKQIIPEQTNQEKTKFLSARQHNEMMNERSQLQKQFTYDSWIIKFLLPDHQLQKQMKSLITSSENSFNSLELFYTFRSIDYLSLYVQPIKNVQHEFNSINDILVPKPQVVNLQIKKRRRNRMFQFYQVEEIVSLLSKPPTKEQRLPLKNSRKLKHLHKSSSAADENMEILVDNLSDEVDSQINQTRLQFKYDNNSSQRSLYKQVGQFKIDQVQNHMHQNVFSSKTISKNLPQSNNLFFIYGQYKNQKQILGMMQEEIKFEYSIPENNEELFESYALQETKDIISNDNWSGNDLIVNYRPRSVLDILNKGWAFYFYKGCQYKLNYIQFKMLQFITFPFVQIVVDSFVCINTLILAFSDFFNEDVSEISDLIVNIVLVIEILLKSICIKRYLYDLINVLGGLLIFLSIIERAFVMAHTESETLLSSFTYIRILKCLYFFRVIKYNTFAQNMMVISYQTFPNYANIALLLFFLILNYAIFSLQIFDFPEDLELSMVHYFGNIYQSWIAVYTITTADDWYGVVVLSTTYSSNYIAFIFCISLIFILNYFGLGLAFVIILDGFATYLENVEEIEEISDEERVQMIKGEEEGKMEGIIINQGSKKQSFSLANILSSLIQPEDRERYKNIECEESLFIFSKANRFRKLCFTVSESQLYKIFIIIIMWGSLLNLIAITYNDDYEQEFWNEFEIIKFICNFFILIDGLIQIITYGVVQSGGYFNSIWVLLDFIYVVCYFCQLFIHHNALGWILFLGYLRPLKVTSQYGFFINERGAIMKSLADILQIFYVVMLFWFIFAIFGMTIYKGKLGYCEEFINFGVGIEHCEEEWKIYPHNFDTIIDAMQSLYVISTLDEWAEIFFIYINSNTAEHGPVRFSNEWPSYIFFFTFTFIGALFFLQFFAGVIFVNFQQNKSQLLNPDLTLDQELFLNLSEIIMEDTPNYSKPAKKGVRLQAKKILNNKYFTLLTNASLLLNLFTLMLLQETASNTYLNILNWFHHFCSFILFIDCIFKLFTHHIRRYFDDGWRQTELIFVIFALIDFILDLRLGLFLRYMRATRDDPYFIWLRLFILNRGLRMTLIIQQFTKIRKLLNVIYFNKMAILRIVGLYVTVISCYSYVGCELFKDIDSGEEMSDQLNFKNFFYGLLTAFKCTTENGWRYIYIDSFEHMHEHHQPYVLASIFYYSLIFIGVRVLMNLIVCELVQEFEKFYDTSSSCLETYVETIDKFRNLWCKYSEDFQGTKIQTKYLAHFLLELGEPLGTQKGDNIWDAAKYASNFELKKDLEGCLSFRNLLYEVFKSAFRESIFKKSTKAGKLIMKNNDKKIKYRLYNQRAPQYRREVVYEVIDLQSNFNILQEYLYLYMALKAWKSFSKHFFSAAEDAVHTIEYSESDADIKIKSEIYNYKIGEDDENENEQEIHSDSQSEEFEIHPVQRQKKRRPTAEHLRRPTDVYILPYYDQIGKVLPGLQIGEYVLKPTEQKQQNKLKSISVIKKKEQLIKYNEYNKRRDAIDKQIQQRNRYLYGYHDKMVVKPIYDEKTERLMSKLDPMKVPSNYNIVKIGSRLK